MVSRLKFKNVIYSRKNRFQSLTSNGQFLRMNIKIREHSFFRHGLLIQFKI